MDQTIPSDYVATLDLIKNRVRSAQYEALKAVNKELIALYWDIGKLIVERQQGDTWGKSVVDRLARDLQVEFPGMQGFSASNLWRIKLFYQTYAGNEILAPLVREIGWSHNIVILEKCKEAHRRRVRPARIEQADRRRRLPHGLGAAAGTAERAARARTGGETAAGCDGGMNPGPAGIRLHTYSS